MLSDECLVTLVNPFHMVLCGPICQDSEMTVSECVRRVVEGTTELYCVDSHVHVHCCDTSVYAPINNILVEKLDRHVVISAPQFTHESHTVEQAR